MFKRILTRTFVISLVLGILASYFFYFFVHQGEFSAFKDKESPEKLNILVVGADIDHSNISRSDTLFFVNIDLKDKGVGLLSIPRDTRVLIPGRSRYEKINAAYAHGGINLTKKTVEDFLGVEIDYYIDIDFSSFERIIDIVGGVEITIPYHMYYVDRAGGLVIDIPPGQRTLDGEQALHYVRYREPIEADIGRIKRQQYLMTSLVSKLLKPETLPKIPALVKTILDSIHTDMTYTDMAQFLNLVRFFDVSSIHMDVVPGVPDETNTYWLANREELELMVESLLESKEYFENRDIRVAIYNGNGTPGLATEIANMMEMQGFTIVRLSNARHYNYEETKIYFNDDAHLERMKEHFSGKSVLFESMDDLYYQVEGADLLIIIGHDYTKRG